MKTSGRSWDRPRPTEKEKPMQVTIDDVSVRFTPDGKLYIVDAIAALAQIQKPSDLWETLQKERPQVKQYVDYRYAGGDPPRPITDSEGWDHIQEHLFDHLIETARDK